jgi:Leucine-rich repeat (LRR) protein
MILNLKNIPINNKKLHVTSTNIKPEEFLEIFNIKHFEEIEELQWNNRSFSFNLNVLCPEIANLINLTYLDLTHNQIKIIPESIQKLTKLSVLKLTDNELTTLPNTIFQLTKLEKLYINKNRLVNINPNINSLTNLTELSLEHNKLKNLPNELYELTNLNMLNVSYNQLHSLSSNIQNLNLLLTLNVDNNCLENLPVEIVNLTRLIKFTFHTNQIENLLNPIIVRLLARFENQARKSTNSFYNNGQNVHNLSIQKSVKSSIFNLLNQLKTTLSVTTFNQIIQNNLILTELTKSTLIEYCNDTHVHTELNCTYNDLLQAVFCEINNINKELQNEVIKRLDEEILDGLGKCFTGRMARLVNVLSGFSDKVVIYISQSDEISNIISLAQTKFVENNVVNIDKVKEWVVKELKERQYDQQTIDEWVKYIE